MKKIVTLFVVIILHLTSMAQPVRVAAAANLQTVIKVLQQDFKKRTGIEITPIIGSSGNLVAQLKNGAPFDLFLSADMAFADALYQDNLTTARPVVYAMGSLVICSTQNLPLRNWKALLTQNTVSKIAIGNPAVAPYGKAAQQALNKLGMYDKLKPKLVFGESIAQVNTYIITGVVTLGFTTQALVADAGQPVKFYWQLVNPTLYQPIEQGMVQLKRSANNPDALKFYNYLLSPFAKAIFKKYGYRVK